MSRFSSLWRNLVHRAAVDDDLDEELRAAFDLLVDEYVASGMSADAARRAATLHLGRMDAIKTEVRQTRRGAALEALSQDVSFAVRLLRRSPLFAVTAILSLSAGIGANAAIFSLVNGLLLRDLRVSHPGQLVEVDRVTPRGRGSSFSYPAYEMLRDGNTVFSGVIAMSMMPLEGAIGSTDRPPSGRFVSGNFFDVLGVTPLLGRPLAPADDAARSAVMVISYGYWQREFGGSADVLGRTVRVDAVPFTIAGVLRPGFDDIARGHPADFFIPIGSEPLLRADSWLKKPDFNWMAIVGRLHEGASIEGAAANLGPIFARFLDNLAARMPDADAQRRIRSHRLALDSARTGLADLRRQFSRPVLLMMGAVSLVLLIACANVVNLLLARGVTRRREIALRLAIGASRSRLIRQLLTEAIVLGLTGGALGLLMAAVGAPLLVTLVSQGHSPIDLDVAPDTRVLVFTMAVALASSLLAGIVPAFRTARTDITPSFQGDTRALSMTRGSTRWGRALIVVQVALSILLLVGASLLLTTLRNIRGFDPGFDREHVLLLRLDPAASGYDAARLGTYYRDVLARVRATPGVRAASLSMVTPISGGGIDQPFAIEGRPSEPGVTVYANRMSEGFFATMGTPVLRGRDFLPQEGDDRRGVAIVNNALVQRYFKDEDPLGRRILLRADGPLEIVGVAANAKYLSLRESDVPTVYVYALDDRDRIGLELSIRTSGDPLAVAPDIRRAVEAIAPTVRIHDVRTMSSQVDRSLATERLLARLLSALAALAVLLACLGLYGVLGYAVARKTGEIGVRLALGATRGRVLRSVLRESSILVAIGCAVGVPAAVLSSRLVSSLLYGVTGSDPGVLGAAGSCLFAVAMLAAALPAWRASRVDPLIALRHE
jgi:predicted permease